MKRMIAFLIFGLAALAQGAPTIIGPFLFFRCTGTSPAFLGWTGATYACIALPTGATLVNGVLTFPAVIPSTQLETVSLTNVAVGAATVSYTPLHTPINGPNAQAPIIHWQYNSPNLIASVVGDVAYTGAPITLSLPAGWVTTDTFTIKYQSQ